MLLAGTGIYQVKRQCCIFNQIENQEYFEFKSCLFTHTGCMSLGKSFDFQLLSKTIKFKSSDNLLWHKEFLYSSEIPNLRYTPSPSQINLSTHNTHTYMYVSIYKT